ncbi:hypothetical protein [Actinoplanes sp. NPDC051494]|uniref:hypothetical protein n=1 Tax=Actinoplanes sp. NPDC051494 TaxID=3363907 RepID=UPI0037A26EE4
MSLHEVYTDGRTIREWFVVDKRDAVHRVDSEAEGHAVLAESGNAVGVYFRDVVTGPLVEVAAR